MAAQRGGAFVLDLLFGQDGCEVFHLEDLADFDFVVAGAAVGAALDPLDGLFERLEPVERTRTPSAEGRQPSVESRIPS